MRKVLTIPMARFARNVRFGPAAIALPVKPFTDPQCVSTERRTQQKREVRGINGNYDVVAIWSLTEQDDATNLLPGATQQIVRACEKVVDSVLRVERMVRGRLPGLS